MVTWGYRHDKTETSRCNRYRSLDLDWNIPICSMYGIFTNIWPNNITQLEVNIPYIEHMGYWNLENILKLGSWPLYPEKNAENWPWHLTYIYIYNCVYIYIIIYIYILHIYIHICNIYIYITYTYIYTYILSWSVFSSHPHIPRPCLSMNRISGSDESATNNAAWPSAVMSFIYQIVWRCVNIYIYT